MASKQKERLAKQISQLRSAIKRKYKQFKYGTIETEQNLRKQYKPILEEMRKNKTGDKANNNNVKLEPKKEEDEEEVEQSFYDESSDNGDDTFGLPHFTSSPNGTLRPTDISTALSSEDGQESASRFVERNFDHHLTKEYMGRMFTDIQGKKSTIDHIYGPRYENETLMVGNKQLQFKSDGSIYVESTRFKPTPGLYELIFNRVPDKDLYDDNDLRAYKAILQKTNAHKKGYTNSGKINRNKSTKYRSIIKDLFPGVKEGRGYKSALKRDISYWDDPNELCDRLRLLVASTDSGNRGHGNEVINIIEELKEAGFIKGRGNSRFRSILK